MFSTFNEAYEQMFSAQQPQTFDLSIAVNLRVQDEKSSESDMYLSVPVTMDTEGRINLADIGHFFISLQAISPHTSIFYYDLGHRLHVYTFKLTKIQDFWVKKSDLVDEWNNQTIYLKTRDCSQFYAMRVMAENQSAITETTGVESFNDDAETVFNNENFYVPVAEKSIPTEYFPQPEPQFTNMAVTDCSEISTEKEAKKDGRKDRHRQRTIREAEDLIKRWRELHEGVLDTKTKKIVKYKLVDAAELLGVPKKSLDDYLLMINHGRKYGFDFDSNMNEGFGVLRKFLNKVKKGK